ncbi:MAG: AAA family ATPase [Trebonia sp.]|uniref:AAA family ATPase n=1 Tax=Trebonia sp. TaxID=2767075 RepID=UPI003BB19E78
MTDRATALIGRDGELEIIAGFLEQAAAEGGAFLLVGEPGAGKTALLDAAADAAEETGIQVLRAGGVEFEADLAYSGLNQVLLPVFGQFERLGATHRDALNVALGYGDGPPPDRLLVSTATLTVLLQAAAARPVLMVVDDLPWLDRASAGVLGFVARRLAGSRVGFLAALRPGEESFFERAGLPQHELGPLHEQAANALVSSCFPELAPRVRLRVVAEAQGNPLALLELPAMLSGAQRAAAEALPMVLPLSRRLQALFASRAADLPEPARRLLLLAVLEGSGDLRVLQAAAGPRQIEDLAPAEQAGLVRVDDRTGRLVFRHPLTRSAIVELSTSGERRRAHRALAAQLADEPERRAWHLGEAAVEPDEKIAGLLEETAQWTLRRADAVGAVSALLRAAELSPAAADRSRRLAQAAAVGAAFSLETDTVSKLLSNAGEASPESATYLLTAVAAAFVLLNGDGDVITAHRLLTQAIEDQARPDRISDTGVFEAVSGLFLMCRLSGRPELWTSFHAAISGFAPDVPKDLYLLGQTCADPVRTAAGVLPLVDAAIAGLRSETDHLRILTISSTAHFTDRQPGCREALWRVVREGRRGSGVAPLITALDHLGLDAWLAGHWDQAQELADEGLELSLAHGYPLLTWAFRYRQALIAAACGAYDGAHTLTDEMLRWAAPRRIGQAGLAAHHVGSVAALGRGDFEDAYQHATAISPAGVLASHVPLALWVLMDLVEAAVRTGRHTEAAAHVTAIRDAGIAAISPRLALLAAGSEAIATADSNGLGLFEEALAIPGVDRFPFDLARVQFLYGERLRRARSTKESRPHLAAALEIFERLGARPWASRAARELQATGQTNAFPDQPAHDSLTPQERQIAMLAAAGLSNKEIGQRLFLSHRTVGAHLYQIFPKLGIRSRAALRDALAELPEPLHARSQ